MLTLYLTFYYIKFKYRFYKKLRIEKNMFENKKSTLRALLCPILYYLWSQIGIWISIYYNTFIALNLTYILLVWRLISIFVHPVHIDHCHFFGWFFGWCVKSGRFWYGSRIGRWLLFIRCLLFTTPPTLFLDCKENIFLLN